MNVAVKLETIKEKAMGKFIKYISGGLLMLLGMWTHSDGFSNLGRKLLNMQPEQPKDGARSETLSGRLCATCDNWGGPRRLYKMGHSVVVEDRHDEGPCYIKRGNGQYAANVSSCGDHVKWKAINN